MLGSFFVFMTHPEIERLNNIVIQIVKNQADMVTMIENKSLPWIPSLVPHMNYTDEIIFHATRFYMHVLITRHVKEIIEMWVDVDSYASSNYATQIEDKLSELISLCTGRTFLELTESYLWKS